MKRYCEFPARHLDDEAFPSDTAGEEETDRYRAAAGTASQSKVFHSPLISDGMYASLSGKADKADVRAARKGGAVTQRTPFFAQRLPVGEGAPVHFNDRMGDAGIAEFDIGAPGLSKLRDSDAFEVDHTRIVQAHFVEFFRDPAGAYFSCRSENADMLRVRRNPVLETPARQTARPVAAHLTR